MRVIKIILLAALILLSGALAWAEEQDPLKGLLVLCYHDVPKAVDLDPFGVDRAAFVQQIEYLRTHGYRFVSLDEVIKANKQLGVLPEKPVLLTFDDAYLSFYEFVFPLLKLYGYPCVLSVITSWVDSPPKNLLQPLMSWEQLKEVAKSNLVEIATHTHELHKAVVYNAAGNTATASSCRIYYPKTKTYETDEAFSRRVNTDLKTNREILRKKLGIAPRGVTWPYGEYNQLGAEEAKKLWFEVMLALEVRFHRAEDILTLGRSLIIKNPSATEFIAELKRNFQDRVQLRVLHADLDLIYDDDPAQRERNLDAFLERVVAMRVTTVFLQAFCDEEGAGEVRSVYFPNRLLPVRGDFFSRVTNQLLIRGIEVYAWMPTLAVVLPDNKEEARLSQLEILYEDLAANCRFSGVVFNDDAYLEADEKTGEDKTQSLIDLTERLKTAVRQYRPNCRFARILYADALLSPSAEERFAQSFEKSLPVYDYVVIMAYPLMEKARNPARWFKELVEAARKYPDGLSKTVFKVQAYDWRKREWIETARVLKWLRILVASGAQHIGYYPDSCLLDRPQARVIRRIMSVEDFPFKRKYTEADFLK